ncbi:MAG TPA: hypothetical protein VGR62_18590 [Candidatus Binatia bacterium]|nr:hypothetical protein [Candidatus Binatia bacterium]
MRTAKALPLVLTMVLLGACTPPAPKSASKMEWQKTSDLAPGLEDARQNCKVQTLAETSDKPTGTAVVGGEFVKCMRAAGWTLVDNGTK